MSIFSRVDKLQVACRLVINIFKKLPCHFVRFKGQEPPEWLSLRRSLSVGAVPGMLEAHSPCGIASFIAR